MADFLEYNEDVNPLIKAIDKISDSIDSLNRTTANDNPTKYFKGIQNIVDSALKDAIAKTQDFSDATTEAVNKVGSELDKLKMYYSALEQGSADAYTKATQSMEIQHKKVQNNMVKSTRAATQERMKLEANASSAFVQRLDYEANEYDRKQKEMQDAWIAEEEAKHKKRNTLEKTSEKTQTARLVAAAKTRNEALKREESNLKEAQIQDAKVAADKYIQIQEGQVNRQVAIIKRRLKEQQRLYKQIAQFEKEHERAFIQRLDSEANEYDRKQKEMRDTWIAEEKAKNSQYNAIETANEKQRTARLVAAAKARNEALKREESDLREAQIQDAKVAADKYIQIQNGQVNRQVAIINARLKEQQRIRKQEQRMEKERERAARTWTAKLFGLNTALEDHERSIEKVIVSWGFFARLLLVQLAHRAVAEVTYALKEAVKQAAELSIRIGELQSISLDSFAVDSEWLKGLANLSGTFGKDIQDQTEAAYQALSNQISSGTDAIKFLEEANRLAITAVMDTTGAVELLTGALNAYGASTDQAAQYSASFFKMIELGRLRGEEMADSFGDVAILARQLNIDINALQASLAAMSIQGIKYNKAATQMRGIMVKLLKPTKEMAALFRDLGVASGEEAVEVYGWIDLLNEFQKRTAGSSTEMAALFSRIRGLSGALAFTGDGFETVKRYYAEIQAAGDSYAAAFENSMGKAARELKQDVEQLKNLFLVEWGQPLLEILADISKETGGLTNRFKSLAESVSGFAKVFATLGVGYLYAEVALYAIGIQTKVIPALIAWRQGLTSVKLAAVGITAAFIAAEIAVQAINALVDKWEAEQEAIADAYLRNVERLKSAELNRINALRRSYMSAGKQIVKTAAKYIGQVNALAEKHAEAAEDALKSADKAAKKTTSALSKYANALQKNIDRADTSVKKLKAKLDQLAKDFENREFNWRFSDAETNIEKIKLLSQQIAKLGRAYNRALSAGNKSAAINYLEEAIKLQGQLRELQVDSNKDIKKSVKELREAYKEMSKERVALEEEYKNKAKEVYKELKKQEQELVELRKKYSKATSKEEREAIKKQIQELRQERKETIEEKKNLSKEYKKESAELREKYRKEVSEEQKSIKEAGGIQGQDVSKTEDNITAMMKTLHDRMLEFANAEHKLKMENEQKLYAFRLRMEQRGEAQQEIKSLSKDYTGMPSSDINTAYQELVTNFEKYKQAMEEIKASAGVDVTVEISEFSNTFEQIKKSMQDALVSNKLKELQKEAQQQNSEIAQIMEGVYKKEDRDRIITSIKQRFEMIKELFATMDGEISGESFAKQAYGFDDKQAEKFEDLRKLVMEADGNNESILKVLEAWQNIDLSGIDVSKIGKHVGEKNSYIYRTERTGFLEGDQRTTMQAADAGKLIAKISEFQNDISEASKALTQGEYMSELKKMIDSGQPAEVFTEQWEAVAKTDKQIGSIIEKLKKELELEIQIARVRGGATDRTGKAMGGVAYHASGDLVRGTDSVAAMLTPGEFVMNRKATAAHLPELMALNSNAIGFSGGGHVTNVGDIHVTVNSSGNNTLDGLAIGQSVKRAMRRGVLSLGDVS